MRSSGGCRGSICEQVKAGLKKKKKRFSIRGHIRFFVHSRANRIWSSKLLRILLLNRGEWKAPAAASFGLLRACCVSPALKAPRRRARDVVHFHSFSSSRVCVWNYSYACGPVLSFSVRFFFWGGGKESRSWVNMLWNVNCLHDNSRRVLLPAFIPRAAGNPLI